jgi:hypothetical protein
VAAQRTVLVVVRSPAALHRLLDVLPVFEGDTRVELVFAVDRGSRFSNGLTPRLAAAGARMVAWEDALSGRYDLAVAASDNGDLHRLNAPLVLLPHGVGYQRFAAHEPGAISGLRRSTLVRGDQVVPSTLVVSHADQLDVVRTVEPRLLPHVVVAGDPCFDRIQIGARRRDDYRAAFGATGKRLVVLCSTWGRHSLFGRDPALPTRVVAQLETDRYRTALVLHPNVWAHHGPLQIRTWLRPALDAGLVLLPPDEGWRAALVAADLVISDHGSLTCYAAGNGVPVLLAEDGGPEVVPGSPIDTLRRLLPPLRPDAPLEDQVHDGITAPPVIPEMAEAIFAHHGQAVELLRAAIYRELRLSVPGPPVRVRPVPVPDITPTMPTVYAVRSEVDIASDGPVTVVLRRFPAVTYDEDQPHARHLAANDAEDDPGWVERAAVVWQDNPHRSVAEARAWATRTVARLPAVRVAVAPLRRGGALVVLRGGRELLAVGTSDAALIGSAIHSCAVHGVALDGMRRLEVSAGAASATVRVRTT